MEVTAAPRSRRGLRAVVLTTLTTAGAALFATAALAAPNPSSVTPTFVADGNAYNDPPACNNKINGDTGVISGDLNGSDPGGEYTITLTGNATDKTASFTITGAVVTQVVVKASGEANIFSYGVAGVTSDTVFGTGKDATVGDPDRNGVDTANELIPADERSGVSHVCFDVSAGVGTTAASFRSLTATKAAGSVLLRWKTAAESEVLGYNVYAQVNGKRVKLNKRLIAGKGVSGGAYAYKYRTPKGKKAPARFWVETVNLDGTRNWRSVRAL